MTRGRDRALGRSKFRSDLDRRRSVGTVDLGAERRQSLVDGLQLEAGGRHDIEALHVAEASARSGGLVACVELTSDHQHERLAESAQIRLRASWGRGPRSLRL